MKTKLKHCDGECQADKPIWANFEGKRYCAKCWQKIKPTVPLKRSALSPSRTPLPKQSDRRKKEDIVYKVLNKQFLKDHPVCMIGIPGVCSRQKTNQVHHTYSGKDRTKYFLDTSTWLATEQSCHDWCHMHPKEARELGFLK